MSINYASFTGNTSSTNAGALSVNCAATIENSSFTTNTASWNGGAISVERDYAVSITSCTFTGNVVTTTEDGSAGALYAYSGTTTLNGVTMTGNEATLGSDINIYHGATIELKGATNISNIYFYNDSATVPKIVPYTGLTLSTVTSIVVTPKSYTSNTTVLTAPTGETLSTDTIGLFSLTDTGYELNSTGAIVASE